MSKPSPVATLLPSCPHQHPNSNCRLVANQLHNEPGAQNSQCPEVSNLQLRVPSPHFPAPKADFRGTRDPLVPQTTHLERFTETSPSTHPPAHPFLTFQPLAAW